MNNFIKRLENLIEGCITGFDRIVFKGFIRPLIHENGARTFCRMKGILNKDYKNWMLKNTEELVEQIDKYARNNSGQGIIPIATWRTRKEELAHERQKQTGIKNGLIGVWSCLEAGSSYRAYYQAEKGYPELRRYSTRCKHLYFYFDHEEYGFMNIRLQTWFPYHIQICLNGREWLRRSLDRQRITYLSRGNKFFHISDYEKAQHFLDSQMDIRWADILNDFLPTVFPTMTQILNPHLSYYWTMWQSEWATDIIFDSAMSLTPIMDSLLRHSLITGTSPRILRYLDRPLKTNGSPYSNLRDEVLTRVSDFNEGLRVRHWVDNNSVKVYNEQNVLRVETTINKPEKFRVHRHKEGQLNTEKKLRLPLRKGISDIPLRAKVSQEVNDRFIANLNTFEDKTPIRQIFDDITRSRTQNGRPVRALDPTGKDRELLEAISDPAYSVSGLTNKSLRESLAKTAWGRKYTEKQLSAKISRNLRLLREHGIIKKLPNQHKYQLTIKGMKITNSLNAFLASSTEKLMKMVA